VRVAAHKLLAGTLESNHPLSKRLHGLSVAVSEITPTAQLEHYTPSLKPAGADAHTWVSASPDVL
jgi:hypothetical protein